MSTEGHSYTFPKSERLCGKKEIEELFKYGSSFYLHPFRFKYLPGEKESNFKVIFSVPKKKFKRAVDRNLIKRRLRESYRLNKHLLNNSRHFYYLGFVYTDKEILSYQDIESKMIKAILRFNREIEGKDKQNEE